MGQSSSSSSSSNNETPHTPLMHRGRQEEKARNNYNRLANCYDCWASWEKPYLIHALNLFDLKNQNQNVLEIGCGTGWVCEQICLAGNNITGLDISEEMCKVTTKRLEKSCTTDAFTILKGSAKKLPLEDTSFDCVIVCFTLELMLLSDIKIVLSEIQRVLLPGGRLIAVSMSNDENVAKSCPMGCYRCCNTYCDCVVDCSPIALLDLVSDEKNLTPIQSETLPFYGLAVQSVICKRCPD